MSWVLVLVVLHATTAPDRWELPPVHDRGACESAGRAWLGSLNRQATQTPTGEGLPHYPSDVAWYECRPRHSPATGSASN